MIAIVSAPIFSRRVSKAKSKLLDVEVFSLVCKLVLSIFTASFIIFVLTSLFSEIIISFINEEFTSHSNIFVIFGVVGVAYSCYFFSYNLMMMLGMQNDVRKIVFYSFFVSNVLSMPVLAISPEYFVPAFIAVGSVFSTVMMFLAYRRRLHL
jgi:O-antigen/teichoic acid export membrane protein